MTTLLLTLLLAAPSNAELNERFSRGVRLFDEGRVGDALLEFEALEALKPNPVVRFNLAHCHARQGHPLRAVPLLEALLKEKQLAPDRLAAAERLLVEQRGRIATLELSSDAGPLEGVLELDGVSSRATLPMSVQVDPGTHNLSFQSPGYFPARQVGVGSPGARTAVSLTLVKAERPPARLRVRCAVPAVEVLVDGALVATTPVATALLIPPGTHTLEARRAGYAPYTRTLALSENTEESLDVELAVTGAAAALRVVPSEPQAVVTVNGALTRADAPVQLPAGPHRVRVEREGFFPTQQDVVLDGDLKLAVTLEPTTETLAQLARGRAQHRFWGVLGVAVGGAAGITGSLIWGLNLRQMTAVLADVQRLAPLCKTMSDGICPRQEYGEKSAELTNLQWVSLAGILTAGLGAAVTGAGLLSLFTAPDLSRYEERPSAGPLAPLSLSVGPGSIGVSGRF